ncbi:MAG: CapA family protein [Cyanobacteria bacterium J06639_16]
MSNLALEYHQEERPSIKQEAAGGSFRAIALWLNEYLVPQQIFAQVGSTQPGCLQVIVEFHQPPHRDRLVRFICHRLWHLNSELIEGAHIIARIMGQTRPLWQEKVRISTAASRANQTATTIKIPTPKPIAQPELPPQIAQRKKAVATPPYAAVLNRHLKVVRAFLISGSAVAAFLFGCFAEIMVSNPGPALPVISQAPTTSGEQPEPDDQTAVLPVNDPGAVPASRVLTPESNSFQEASRPNLVNAPLEPVAVIQHDRVMYPADPNVILLFGGEIDLDDLPYDTVETDAEILGTLADYQQADVAMIGLGDPLTSAGTQPKEELYNHQRPDAVQVLKQAGVDMVNLSSGNLLEFGEYGLEETLTTLDREGLYRVGAGRDGQEARRPEILEVKGQRIAYLAYNQDDLHEAYKDAAGINAQGKRQVIEDIRTLRSQVDWIVVNYRWQEEVPQSPADWQTNLARMAIDQGADVVVGYHPSQIQGAEIYKGRPIAYSLGDFVFGNAGRDNQRPAADYRETAMLKISVRPEQMKVDLLPVVIDNDQPQLATGVTADAILRKIETASIDFNQPMQVAEVLDIRPRHQAPLQRPTQQPSDGGFTSPGETPPSQDAPSFSPGETTSPSPAPLTTPAAQPRRDSLDDAPAPASESPVAPTQDSGRQETNEGITQPVFPSPNFLDENKPTITPIQSPAGATGNDPQSPQPTLIPDPSVPRINQPVPSSKESSDQVPFESELEIQLDGAPSDLLPEWGPKESSDEDFESIPDVPQSLPLPETMPGLTLDDSTSDSSVSEDSSATQAAPPAMPNAAPELVPPEKAVEESPEAEETPEEKATEEKPIEVQPEPDAASPDAIGPYHEPLVGPLSSAETDAAPTPEPQPIALSADGVER